MTKIFTSILFLITFLISCTPKDKSEQEILSIMGLESESGCEVVRNCGDLSMIDCGAAVDGPLYYINVKKKKLVQCCGGCCDTDQREGTQCSECPPKEWTCP